MNPAEKQNIKGLVKRKGACDGAPFFILAVYPWLKKQVYYYICYRKTVNLAKKYLPKSMEQGSASRQALHSARRSYPCDLEVALSYFPATDTCVG